MTTLQQHIVVAEDEPHLATSLNYVLSAAGYGVSLAKNGRTALQVIQNSIWEHANVDLLITDIAMPIMNGEELICALRKQSIRVPILVITGFSDKELVIKLMRMGCQDFLEKPFEPEELENCVSSILTASLNETLEQKRKEHLALVGEKSRSMVHDLKNILGGTIGYGDLALGEIDTSHPAFQLVEKLLSTATLASDICKQLLSIKPDSPLYLKTKTEIRSIVEKMVTVLETMAPKTITIRSESPEEPVWLNADPERLQQALLNLGVNAIDAMGSTGLLTIKTSIETITNPSGQQEQCVCIQVSDTGPGISKEFLDNLFEKAHTSKPNGHGFGLLTVKRIVDEHSGRITVQSNVQAGTQFTLIFPVILSQRANGILTSKGGQEC